MNNEIRIPEELHARCMYGVKRAQRERKARRSRAVTAACSLAACMLIVAMPTIADAVRGSFNDIRNRSGAVTGTEYLNATDEVQISARASENGGLIVEVGFLYPDDAPYAFIEMLNLGECSPSLNAEAVEITEGRAVFSIDADCVPGSVLHIYSLIGEAKVEQPLEMHGEWTVEVTG